MDNISTVNLCNFSTTLIVYKGKVVLPRADSHKTRKNVYAYITYVYIIYAPHKVFTLHTTLALLFNFGLQFGNAETITVECLLAEDLCRRKS